jgi:hypothetical protein
MVKIKFMLNGTTYSMIKVSNDDILVQFYNSIGKPCYTHDKVRIVVNAINCKSMILVEGDISKW